ncbi:hypothetical protein J7L65_00460 [Candidatus Bathyarchaeota archaeon]|nr:hypothetical protein [Candidatus Bathyarchaeota archaeon]
MMCGYTPLEEYKRRLRKLVERGLVKCPKCGNDKDFMVNEIGHVFCNQCYRKIPMIRLDKEVEESS